MPRFLAIAGTLAGLALSAPGAGPAAAADGKDRVFVGYLYGPTAGLDLRLYTHLCHAFVVADEEGRIRPGRGVPSRELADKAHEAGVRVLLSLGGWGWDKQFAAIASKPEAEDRYVTAILAMIDESDYDGIDFDWEYPDTEAEVAGFERICRRFREGLDAIGSRKGRRMGLTMAASSNPGTLRWLRKEFLLEAMDWINVMTYDMAGDWTSYAGHHSPLHASSRQPEGAPKSTEATIDYLLVERGIPADRVAMGIPLYGRGFAVTEPYAPKKDAQKAPIPRGNYSDLHKLLHEEGWARTWDDETKNPWLASPDRTVVIGYDDAESIAIKAEWADRKGLRGVFFWQVSADRLPDGAHPLQEAARKAWDRGAKPAPE